MAKEKAMSLIKEVRLADIDKEKPCPHCSAWRYLRKVDDTLHAFVCIPCNTTQLVELKGQTNEPAQD